MHAPQRTAAPDLTPLETQPPVGPSLEQLAEEFTQLALNGDFTKVRDKVEFAKLALNSKLLKAQEMIGDITRKFGEGFAIVDIKNAQQQTVSEYLLTATSLGIPCFFSHHCAS